MIILCTTEWKCSRTVCTKYNRWTHRLRLRLRSTVVARCTWRSSAVRGRCVLLICQLMNGARFVNLSSSSPSLCVQYSSESEYLHIHMHVHVRVPLHQLCLRRRCRALLLCSSSSARVAVASLSLRCRCFCRACARAQFLSPSCISPPSPSLSPCRRVLSPLDVCIRRDRDRGGHRSHTG